MKITVRRKHYKNKKSVRKIIDDIDIEKLVSSSLDHKILISNVNKLWNDKDTLEFELRARKGLLIATIKGNVYIFSEEILLDVEVPRIAKVVMGRDEIEEKIGAQLEDMFPEPAEN